MENEPKKVPFKWEYGDEIVSLHVNSYAYWYDELRRGRS